MKENKYAHISDQELLSFYYHRHQNEWLGILLERYTVLLLGVCMKYLKDEEEARDSVQQVFLKVIQELPRYRVTYFKSWLYMVAKNYCLMRLREQQKSATKKVAAEDIDIAVPAEAETPWEQTEKYQTLLQESMTALNEAQRTTVQMFYLQKKSYQEISEHTGYSILQVKSYIQNGKRNLKLLIERKAKASNPGNGK